MADEIRVQSSLSVNNAKNVESRADSFSVTQNNPGGPTPGVITASTTGTDITLPQIGIPGVARFKNIDPTNYVEVGIREPNYGQFYPFLELGPGEAYVVKLSRNLPEGWTTTGTTPADNFLHARANTAAVKLLIEIFER